MNEPTPGGEPHQHGDESDEEPRTAAEPGPAPHDGPRPPGPVVGVTPTGHAPVDAQLRRLEDADHLAVTGHLEVYEDVHRGLRDTLTALDQQEQQHDQQQHDQELNRTWQ